MRTLALLAAAILLAACNPESRRPSADEVRQLTGGDAERGKKAIRRYGCGSCHTIRGVPGAHATVGPPLEKLYDRSYLAGQLPNNAANLIQWIRHPRRIHPATAMPEMAVTEQDARDIAAFLYRQ